MSFYIKFDQESVKHVAHDRKTIGHWWTFNPQSSTPEIKWENNIIPYASNQGPHFKPTSEQRKYTPRTVVPLVNIFSYLVYNATVKGERLMECG